MTYDEAVKAWAAGKVGGTVDSIKDVYFDVEIDNYHCDTCGPDHRIEVLVTYIDGRKGTTIDYDTDALGSIVRELVEFATRTEEDDCGK